MCWAAILVTQMQMYLPALLLNSTMRKHTPMSGFTLVEMAVVLVIVGLLLTGLLVPLGAQLELRRQEETRVALDEAKEALIGYALANNFFPCPDTNAIPNGTEGARAANQCVTSVGVLPWQVLGVRAQDAWGRYIRYRVTPAFTDNAAFFSLATPGGIRVNSDTGTLTTTAVAVVVSHGPNGFGGINTTQATPANQMPAPTGADELENTDADTIYMSHTPTPVGSANEFDDSVNWVSSSILMNRMVAAGQLP